MGWPDLAYREEFEFLADEHQRLTARLDEQLADRHLRRDPDTGGLRAGDGVRLDHRRTLAQALAAVRPGTDLRTELEIRVGGRFELLRDRLDTIAAAPGRQVLYNTVDALLPDLPTGPDAEPVYLLVTTADGGQHAYAFTTDDEGALGYDPVTGREEKITSRTVHRFLLDRLCRCLQFRPTRRVMR